MNADEGNLDAVAGEFPDQTSDPHGAGEVELVLKAQVEDHSPGRRGQLADDGLDPVSDRSPVPVVQRLVRTHDHDPWDGLFSGCQPTVRNTAAWLVPGTRPNDETWGRLDR